MQVKKITIGRTINMGNYQFERQDLEFEVSDSDTPEDVYALAEQLFLQLKPTWGVIHPDYLNHLNKVQFQSQPVKPTGAIIPEKKNEAPTIEGKPFGEKKEEPPESKPEIPGAKIKPKEDKLLF